MWLAPQRRLQQLFPINNLQADNTVFQNKILSTEGLAQNNRFESLVQNEVESSKNKDVELEAEINAELERKDVETDEEISSAQDTEFVVNTRYGLILERIEIDDQIESNTNAADMEKERLLEIEKKNKAFL
jgi:hypothetical protein